MSELHTPPYIVNIGPQHPSTHGVFRLKVTLDGERIIDAEMVLGYLHRSMEKLAEERSYTQNIPFTDRMDYLAAMTGNLGYCLAVEKLAGIEVPERGSYLRVIFAELQRIASHCMANGTFVNDCGAWQTPLMYMFREREKILDLFEMTCGARLTTNYMRIGGVAFDPPAEFWPALRELVDELPERIDEYGQLLKQNEVFIARTRNVGVISPEDAINGSLVGPALRGSGVPWDLRKAEPYDVYERMDFDIPVGRNGDCFDRYLVRVEEMRQSLRIIRQCVEQMPDGPVITDDGKIAPPPRGEMKRSMEALIHHFKLYTEGYRVPAGETYTAVEAPKGEFGVFLVADGTNRPYKCKIRAPGFAHLAAMDFVSKGHMLADSVAILGSRDIVFGEIDR
jgi:NADH-quinone oxidoreductase subunit D